MAKRGKPSKIIKVIEIPSSNPLAPTYEIPAVKNGSYEKPRLDKVKQDYVITFNSIPERVICPNCKKLQFTVNQGSTNAEIVRVCQCGARTIYRFEILPFGLSTSSPLT